MAKVIAVDFQRREAMGAYDSDKPELREFRMQLIEKLEVHLRQAMAIVERLEPNDLQYLKWCGTVMSNIVINMRNR